jgi:hypothetical protein
VSGQKETRIVARPLVADVSHIRTGAVVPRGESSNVGVDDWVKTFWWGCMGRQLRLPERPTMVLAIVSLELQNVLKMK